MILSLIVFSSCEQKTKGNNKNQSTKETQDTVSTEVSNSEKIIAEIDNNITNLNQVHSLHWEKTIDDNSEFREVEAFMNDQGVPSKLIEYFSMGNYKEQGERHYYFHDSQVIAVIKKADEWIDSNTVIYKETKTLYNENKPKVTRVRSAEYIDKINDADWETIRTVSHQTELNIVDNILKGQGKFKTHFISIIKGQEQLFLLLGEPKNEDRYVTTVLVNPETPFIKDLLANMDSYKFKPIDIQFEIVGGKGSPTFRLMTAAEWIH